MKKVVPGQSLVIPAETYNAFVDAAQDFKLRQRNAQAGPRPIPRQNGIVRVKNDSSTDQDRFAVMSISGILISPDDNEDEFINHWALKADVPAADSASACVILLEPLKVGVIGQALIFGVTPVKVTRPADYTGNGLECGTISGDTAKLTMGQAGFSVLWEATYTGTDDHWALVRFNAGGSQQQEVLADVVCNEDGTLTKTWVTIKASIVGDPYVPPEEPPPEYF